MSEHQATLQFLETAVRERVAAEDGSEKVSARAADDWRNCTVTVSAPTMARLLCMAGVIPDGWAGVVDIIHRIKPDVCPGCPKCIVNADADADADASTMRYLNLPRIGDEPCSCSDTRQCIHHLMTEDDPT